MCPFLHLKRKRTHMGLLMPRWVDSRVQLCIMWGIWFHASMQHKPKSRMVMHCTNTYFPENNNILIGVFGLLKLCFCICTVFLVDSLFITGEVAVGKNRPYLKDHGRERTEPGRSSLILGLVQIREHHGAHGHSTPPSAAVNKHLLVQFQKHTRPFMVSSAFFT